MAGKQFECKHRFLLHLSIYKSSNKKQTQPMSTQLKKSAVL